MLDRLRKIIGNHRSEDTSSQPDNPNFITEQGRIQKLIGTIEASSQLCTVTIKGSKKIFSTSIIDFQPEQDCLILDELSPIEGNSLLQAVKVLKLSAYVNGIHLSFKLHVFAHGLKKGFPYYKTVLPTRIYYPQRRKVPRVFIESHTTYFHAQPHKTGNPLIGDVVDLSRGGLCINLTGISVNYERGDILENCWLTLPDGYRLNFDLAVRSVKTLREHNIQVGGHFLNMQPKSKKKLEYFVALLERESIRKQKN